jgi:hypothetical protein
MNRSMSFLSDTNRMRPFRKKFGWKIVWRSDPPTYVQTLLLSKVPLACPAFFLPASRELALREVVEPALRVHSE